MIKLRNALSALILLLSTTLTAAEYNFKTLDARDGLTSSQVNCVLKDSRGFVWFGTPIGLYRYDGYGFKSFQCNSQDSSSLPDSYIISLQEAMDGSLWVKTAVGYCVYHPQTEVFERDMRQVFSNLGMNAVPTVNYIDRFHNLWGYVPERGVVCYNMQHQMTYEFPFVGNANSTFGIPQGDVCAFGECKDGTIIVYTNGMLVCCDVMHQQNVVWATNEMAQRKMRNSSMLRVFADQTDNIWLYGPSTLYVYNKKAKSWNTSVGDQLGMGEAHTDHLVCSMAGDRSGNIWIATNRNGLLRANVNTQTMEHVRLTTMVPSRMESMTAMQCVYVDDTDLLWVGTAKAGVAFAGENIYKFNVNINGDITAMTEDAQGNIVYGTSDNGLVGSPYNANLASLKVTALATTPDGSLWVGSPRNGLARIKDGKTTLYTANGQKRNSLVDNHVNALATDRTGNLWIATDHGLQMLNLKMETFSNYTKENRKLTTNKVTALCRASNNRMLIGTAEGMTVLNTSTMEVRHVTGDSANIKKFTNNYVSCLFEDSRGLIWVGTREGVNILNMETDNLDILNERAGLCNNNICGIAEDRNTNIWITTSNGVSRIVTQRDHEEGTFRYGLYNYSQSDGLQSNEFNIGSILTTNDGTVYMGGLYGINWARTRSADESASLPKVILTELLIGEEEIQVGHTHQGHVPLMQTLNESNSITLLNEENTFTIKFAAGNYNQSERLQFQYMMEGLDNEWHIGDAMKHGVTFNNLGSGEYKLHVKAVSAEGNVSKQERVISITIERPWYLQWWMLMFYTVVILIVLYLWKIGIQKLRRLWYKKQALLEELAIQREEIKSASDDLRQPMARMTSIIMNMSERESTLEEREQLNTLHSQMLQIITRVSDMQSALEHPEERAQQQVSKHYELDSHGEMVLPDIVNEELTTEMRTQFRESPTSKFQVMFIDDNEEFIRFVDARLRYVYDFHAYSDILKAAADIETTMPDLIICKHAMQPMTGSELCNSVKSSPALCKIKFVITTEGKMTSEEMAAQEVSMSADDYLAKPFNIQEAAMRFNKLLGIAAFETTSNLIEGAETRLLEAHNSSMTTATESIDYGTPMVQNDNDPDDEMHAVELQIRQLGEMPEDDDQELGEYAMNNAMDRQLIMNIEQYVVQNMNRGQINLEEMAQAMGMTMRPFFLKVRDITGKTPADVVRDIRLKYACKLLKQTNINMSELATNIGVATGESFITMFKDKFGLSPSEYRQKYRRNDS